MEVNDKTPLIHIHARLVLYSKAKELRGPSSKDSKELVMVSLSKGMLNFKVLGTVTATSETVLKGISAELYSMYNDIKARIFNI